MRMPSLFTNPSITAGSISTWRTLKRFYDTKFKILIFSLLFVMKKSSVDKLFRYVKDGRIKRVRSLLKKHKGENLDEFVDVKGRTVLHVACFLGEHAIVKVLTSSGASVEVKDTEGNSPVHLALHYALQALTEAVYEDLVAPLLQQASQQLMNCKNNYGETPRKLRKKFKWELRRRREDRKFYEEQEEIRREKARNEKEWNEKLFFELGNDEGELFSNMSDETTYTEETYDQWADRIARERYEKKFVGSKDNKEKNPKAERQRYAEERTRLLQEEHEAYIKEISQKRAKRKSQVLKSQYESLCSIVFGKNEISILKFADIPWPCKGEVAEMIKVITAWSEGEVEPEMKRKFLRDQQIRWHPDRFLQKCGDRLDVSDRDSILTAVNHLSQGINALIENE